MKLKRNSKGRFMKRGASSPRRRRRRRHAIAATAAPARRRRRRRNPRGRARRHVTTHVRRRRSSARVYRTHSRRRRRNPRFLGGLAGGGVMKPLMGAAVGAGGAIGLDVLLGYATFLPDSLRTGTPRHFVRLGGALGLGWIAGKVFGRQAGAGVTAGAMTVVLYSIFKDLLQKAVPNLPGLGDYEEMEVGYLDAASVVQDGTGAYMLQDDTGAGAYMEGVEENEGAGAYMEF